MAEDERVARLGDRRGRGCDDLGDLLLVERLGRPYKVLINNDLLRAPEIRPYSLPIDFSAAREAQALNLQTRREALRHLSEGTTIVVFPAGGVATSPTTFGRAVDLPWKRFTARMIHSSRAQVLPLYFEGQCSPLFQFVSKFSLTLRLALIIREFRVRVGQPLRVHVGDVIPPEACQEIRDRQALMMMLYERVHALGGLDDLLEAQLLGLIDAPALVLHGGPDFWSNGMHLNAIEAAESAADASWQNINAIDDLALEIITCDRQLTVAALAGNAGAGGVFLALAAIGWFVSWLIYIWWERHAG